MSRAGFVALAGRPNAGKSTLVNRIVGGKVAIVSDKPQTTRREIRGIATGPDWQLVLVDLPGVQRPRDPLTERMQARVDQGLADADAVLLLLNGEQRMGPGDRFIARAVRNVGLPTVIAVNKVDALDAPRTMAALAETAELDLEGEVFPISALTGAGVPELVEHLVSLLPEGPFLYPPEEKSDLPERVRLAELDPRAGAAAHARGAARTRWRWRSTSSRSARTGSWWCAPGCGPRRSRRRGSSSAPAAAWSRPWAARRGVRSSAPPAGACTST